MSQQVMHSGEMNRHESASNSADVQDSLHNEEIQYERASSSAGYEGDGHQHDFFISSSGQKLSSRDARRATILDQRLVLAIVSLVSLMLMSSLGIGLALVTGAGGSTPAGDNGMFVHAFRHRHDFGPWDGMGSPPVMLYSPAPVHVHHWIAAPDVLPMFVLVYITFTLAVLAINLLFSRNIQRS